MKPAAMVALLAVSSGCSLVGVHALPTYAESVAGAPVSCTSSFALPTVDAVLALPELIVGGGFFVGFATEGSQQRASDRGYAGLATAILLIGAAYAASAVRGYRAVSQCRQAELDDTARAARDQLEAERGAKLTSEAAAETPDCPAPPEVRQETFVHCVQQAAKAPPDESAAKRDACSSHLRSSSEVDRQFALRSPEQRQEISARCEQAEQKRLEAGKRRLEVEHTVNQQFSKDVALTTEAVLAAHQGNCPVVVVIAAQIRALDGEFHDRVFVRDAAIAKCLPPGDGPSPQQDAP